MNDGPALVEAVEHRARVEGGGAFLGRAAHTEVAVADREDRFVRRAVAGAAALIAAIVVKLWLPNRHREPEAETAEITPALAPQPV